MVREMQSSIRLVNSQPVVIDFRKFEVCNTTAYERCLSLFITLNYDTSKLVYLYDLPKYKILDL